ncbi:MAG: helix-turn-helix domain-containing protein [Firmicutes bacterium]|nr:helix-turn-helix domain-containing protein [Bacillota bacterium]
MDTAELRHIFSSRIRKLREGKLNQGEFADSVGISRGAMSYYEQELRTPDIGVLRAICVKYNISADYLLGIIPDPDRRVSDICRETGLSPVAAKKLNLITRLVASKVNSYQELMDIFDQDFLDVVKLFPFTSVPEVLNILLESDEGVDLLTLLGAIILGAEFVSGGDEPPTLKIKSAVKNIELAISVENITAALWVNIQSDADKLREKFQAAPPQSE